MCDTLVISVITRQTGNVISKNIQNLPKEVLPLQWAFLEIEGVMYYMNIAQNYPKIHVSEKTAIFCTPLLSMSYNSHRILWTRNDLLCGIGAVKHYHRPVKTTQYNSSSLQHPLLAPTLDLGDCYRLKVFEGFQQNNLQIWRLLKDFDLFNLQKRRFLKVFYSRTFKNDYFSKVFKTFKKRLFSKVF